MTVEEGRLLVDDESFSRLGLNPKDREPWEDGLRLSLNPRVSRTLKGA